MSSRTFGWIQNPGELKTLRKISLCLCKGTIENKWLLEERLPLLLKNDMISKDNFDDFIVIINSGKYPYVKLKGKGGERGKVKCTGIIQAIIDAQSKVTIKDNEGNEIKTKKPYSDDWTSEGYLRWAVTTGFLAIGINFIFHTQSFIFKEVTK